jgi:tRNA threonylcarbamoyl adenosine modification protein (Sua5/YciO/YrdC/YwlC family)
VSDPVLEAAEAALAGRLVVVPTDTVHGIGTRPDDPAATALLFEAKRRPRELELPILVPDVDAARSVAGFDARAERLAAALWPGPLTLVLPRARGSEGWELGGDPGTVGVRIPRHPLALALLARTGPLAVTSANLSGEPTPSTCEGLIETFGDLVAVYLCEDGLAGEPSTVVDLAHGDARILREGAVAAGEIGALRAG